MRQKYKSGGTNDKLDIVGEEISELKDIAIETTQNEKQRKEN